MRKIIMILIGCLVFAGMMPANSFATWNTTTAYIFQTYLIDDTLPVRTQIVGNYIAHDSGMPAQLLNISGSFGVSNGSNWSFLCNNNRTTPSGSIACSVTENLFNRNVAFTDITTTSRVLSTGQVVHLHSSFTNYSGIVRDITLPHVSLTSISTTEIDVTRGSYLVHVVTNCYDYGTGILHAETTLTSPSGTTLTEAGCGNITFVVPKNSELGEWKVGALAINGANSQSNPPSLAIVNVVDHTEPLISNVLPDGDVEVDEYEDTTELQISTDENSECRYSTKSGQDFSAMEVFDTTGEKEHSTTVTTKLHESYKYYVKCEDEHNNINADEVEIAFSTIDRISPKIINKAPTGNISISKSKDVVSLTLETDEVSKCAYSLEAGMNFDNMTVFTQTNATKHSTDVYADLNESYAYYIKCRDKNGNTNTNDAKIAFTTKKDYDETQEIDIDKPALSLAGKAKKMVLSRKQKLYIKKKEAKLKGDVPELAEGYVKIEGKNGKDKVKKTVIIDKDGRWKKKVKLEQNGTWKLKITFYDKYDDKIDSSSYEVVVDTHDPEFINTETTQTIKAGDSIGWTAQDNRKIDKFKVKFNGKNYKVKPAFHHNKEATSAIFVIPAGTAPGVYEVEVRAYDKAHNKAVQNIEVHVN